jgi:hypothetical protein
MADVEKKENICTIMCTNVSGDIIILYGSLYI